MTIRTSLLDRQKALLDTHLAIAMTGAAGIHGRTRLGPVAPTAFTLLQRRNADFRGFTGNGGFQVQIKVIAQVGTACGALSTAHAATENVGEDIAEDITEAAGSTAETAASGAATQSGMTELIVGRLFLIVGQDFVGFRGFLETSFRRLITWIAIMVIIHVQPR